MTIGLNPTNPQERLLRLISDLLEKEGGTLDQTVHYDQMSRPTLIVTRAGYGYPTFQVTVEDLSR